MRRASCAPRSRAGRKAAGLAALSAVWLAARSGPASVAQWEPSRACSGFRIVAGGVGIVSASITTATPIFTAIDNFYASLRDGPKDQTTDVRLHIGEF